MDYEYTLKAKFDMGSVTPALWANTPLQQHNEMVIRLKMTDPVNNGLFSYGGVYTPDALSLEINGVEEEAPGSHFGNGGNWADITVLHHPTGFWQGDGLFADIEPRALTSLPFGDIGKFSFRLWLDNSQFSTIDPPTDDSFMNSWPSLAHPSKIEWHFLNPGGIGTGFTWGVTGIDAAAADIRAS